MISFSDIKKWLPPAFFIFVTIYWIIGTINNSIEDQKIDENYGKTVGQVTGFGGGKASNFVYYKYLINGKWYSGADNDAKRKWVEEKDYYRVEYNLNKPSSSRLVTNRKPYNPAKLLDNYTKITGRVTRVGVPSKRFIDLYYQYEYLDEVYDYRTRIHKDSLPCGDIKSCRNAKIEIRVCNYFPKINDLYYKSYDRQNLFKKMNKKYY